MNSKSVFKLVSLKGPAQTVVQQGVSILIISSVALSLVALTGYGRIVQASGPEPNGQPSIEMLRNIDPADRKFFNSGYGVMSSGSKEAEVLPAIDPADRKFFNPGYGAQPVIAKEAEVLPTVDSADRKFFNPGYGVQTTSATQSEAVLPPIENEMGEWSAIWFLLK